MALHVMNYLENTEAEAGREHASHLTDSGGGGRLRDTGLGQGLALVSGWRRPYLYMLGNNSNKGDGVYYVLNEDSKAVLSTREPRHVQAYCAPKGPFLPPEKDIGKALLSMKTEAVTPGRSIARLDVVGHWPKRDEPEPLFTVLYIGGWRRVTQLTASCAHGARFSFFSFFVSSSFLPERFFTPFIECCCVVSQFLCSFVLNHALMFPSLFIFNNDNDNNNDNTKRH
jgi:hypothetical protein